MCVCVCNMCNMTLYIYVMVLPYHLTCTKINMVPCSTAKHKVNSLLKWDELHPSLQKVLPPDDDYYYSYVVETYQEINNDSPHFSATVRVNLANEDDAKQWMEKMFNHSLCAYRTTKTVKTTNKRVKYKFV